MNGRKSKAIRREVYGDQSQRQARQYVARVVGNTWSHTSKQLFQLINIRNAPGSLRAVYQAAKRRGGK